MELQDSIDFRKVCVWLSMIKVICASLIKALLSQMKTHLGDLTITTSNFNKHITWSPRSLSSTYDENREKLEANFQWRPHKNQHLNEALRNNLVFYLVSILCTPCSDANPCVTWASSLRSTHISKPGWTPTHITDQGKTTSETESYSACVADAKPSEDVLVISSKPIRFILDGD